MISKRLTIALILILYSFQLIGQSSSEEILDDLISIGIEIDNKDQGWILENNHYCKDLCDMLDLDSTNFSKATVQILIKLESNLLINLSADQILIKKDELEGIIHGAFTTHDLDDRKKLPASSWYRLFMTEANL